jgi:hypothetical protein
LATAFPLREVAVSDYVDEPVDQDLLLAFETEPDTGNAQESSESLDARVARLERELELSTSQVASLKSGLATLVAQNREIKKPSNHAVAAIAGLLIGVSIGISGWLLWSRDAAPVIQAAPAPAPAAEQRAVAPVVEPPVIALASATTSPAPQRTPVRDTTGPVRDTAARVRDVAVAVRDTAAPARDPSRRAVPAKLPVSTRTDYVGTLSIDAAPGGQVFINRQAAGVTPLRVSNLKAGSHLVWIERDGYRRWTRVVQVQADHVSRVSADLERIAER